MLDGEEWISGHIFLQHHDTASFDNAIVYVVEPFVKESLASGLVNSFFFTRYQELGPHVRVRVRAVAGALGTIHDLLTSFVQAYAENGILGSPRGPLPPGGCLSSHPSLAWIPYAPELTRYGGDHAIAVAERFFEESTDVAFKLLPRIRTDALYRNGIALALMLVLLRAAFRSIHELLNVCHSFYESIGDASLVPRFERALSRQSVALTLQMSTCWEAANSGDLPCPIDEYAAAANHCVRSLEELVAAGRVMNRQHLPVRALPEALRLFVPSYMHMMNNKLGLSTVEEAFLAYGILRLSDRALMSLNT